MVILRPLPVDCNVLGWIRVSVEHARGSGRRGGRDDRNDRDRDRGSRRSSWMDNK